MSRTRWNSRILATTRTAVPRGGCRMRGFNFRSKPYQDFSLSLDNQLAELVRKWQTKSPGVDAHCSAGHCGAELG